MNHLALIFTLLAPAASGTTTPPVQRPSMLQPQPDLSEAERLFKEGMIKYDSADYVGAIDSFTQALGEAESKGSQEFQVRGLLLYNIGKARIHAYDIDHDIGHLRQARIIYKRFIKEADVEAMFEKFNPRDVVDAQQELRMLEARIKGLESVDKEPLPSTPPVTMPVVDQKAVKKARNLGIGFTASGSAVVVAGVALVVGGSQLRSSAETSVSKLDDLGVPEDHASRTEGEEFIDAETRRGRIFMAVGGSVAAVGVVGIGVGVAALVKSKRLREGRVQPSVALTPGYAGIVLSGRF